MRTLLKTAIAFGLASGTAFAAEPPSEVTLIQNVNVWDGRSDGLKMDQDILIVRNLIKKIAKDIPTSGTYELDQASGAVKEKGIHVGTNAYSFKVVGEDGKSKTEEVKVNVIDGGAAR